MGPHDAEVVLRSQLRKNSPYSGPRGISIDPGDGGAHGGYAQVTVFVTSGKLPVYTPVASLGVASLRNVVLSPGSV